MNCNKCKKTLTEEEKPFLIQKTQTNRMILFGLLSYLLFGYILGAIFGFK